MGNRPTARIANGVVSAVIVVFFFVHGVLGSVGPFVNLPSALARLVWVGMVLVGVHVVASIVTSALQLSDKERPPSVRKKRHLALKWVTGVLVALVVVAHVACIRTYGPDAAQTAVSAAAVTLALIVVLATHVCVGAKSLLTDIGLSKDLKTPLRIAVCVLAVAIGCAVLVGIAGL